MIAFIASLIEHFEIDISTTSDKTSLFLVVAPLSVLPNWMEQFERFAPTIDVLMFAGEKKDRQAIEAKVLQTKEKVSCVVVYLLSLSFA